MWYYGETEKRKTICWEIDFSIILENMKRETSYLSISVKTKEGIPLVDEIAVTEDEKDIATAEIKDAIADCANQEFDKLHPNPIQINDTNIVLMAFAEKGFEGREGQTEQAIETYVTMASVAKWLTVKGLASYMQMYVQRMAQAQANLHRNLFKLRSK